MSLAVSRLYEYSSVGEKDPLIVSDGYKRFNVRLDCINGSAKLQHTLYPKDVINADPSVASWEDWPFGVITSAKSAALVGAPTAIRVVVLSGDNIKLEVNVTEP